MARRGPLPAVFRPRILFKVFEVQRQPIPASSETPEAKARRSIQDRIDKANEKERKTIEITDPAQEPDAWLRKVKWHYHLVGKDPERLRTLVRVVDEGEEMLAVIHASFKRVIKACCIHATDEVVGESALCTVKWEEGPGSILYGYEGKYQREIPDGLVPDIELYYP
jgi:hypothetical protein